MFTTVLIITTVVVALMFLAALEKGKYSFAAILICVTGVVAYACYVRVVELDSPQTPEQVAEAEKRKAKIEEAKIPKVFSQTSDGCIVYKFVDNGYNHYFTRCEQHVSTDSTYRSGKFNKVETIKTYQEPAK